MSNNKDIHTDKSSDILPCPFCAHSDDSVFLHTDDDADWLKEVYCDNCGASSSSCSREQTAIDLWNTRATVYPWVPIGDIPQEWKDGRSVLAWCKANECQFEAWYDSDPEANAWVSTHAWGKDIEIQYISQLKEPPVLPIEPPK